MKFLITGGLGQVGSSIAEVLSKHHEVVILDNYSNNYIKNDFEKDIDIINGDIRNLEIVKTVSENVDCIIHTAAQIDVNRSINDPIYDADNNLIGTLNMLEAARNCSNIQKFIYFSSAAVFGIPAYLPIDEKHPCNPISPYGLSKLTGEKYCLLYHRLYNLPVACIRPFNIYSEKQDVKNPYSGVISKFIEKVLVNEPPIIFGNGEQTRDFVHVTDVVAFIELIIENDDSIGEVFNVGTGRSTSINELAHMILTLSGKEDLGVLYEQKREGDIEQSFSDIEKSMKLGYKPKMLIEDGLEDMLTAVKN